MKSFQKHIFVLLLVVMASVFTNDTAVIAAKDPSISSVYKTSELWDRGTYHVIKYASDAPVQSLGFVNGSLLATLAPDQHHWLFKNEFVRVQGTDPAKALGYTTRISSESLLSVPKKSPCLKFKDSISAISVNDKQTLCLRATPGGDFTLDLLPQDTKISVGFGKQPVLEKNKLSWIGIDGNIYVAYLHPTYYYTKQSAFKTKTNNAVFLLRNGVKYSIPSEQIYYTWFDSFKTVTEKTAKTIASYLYIGNISFRENSLLKFKGSPEVYVFQPANDPYVVYGKTAKILTDEKDLWTIKLTSSKTPVTLKKRPELIRHLTSESDAIDLLGPTWTKQIIEIDENQKVKYTISEKPFSVSTDLIVE